MSSASAPAASANRARWILLLEGVIGFGVMVAIVSQTYGAFPSLTFGFTALSVAYTGWVVTRMLSSLADPTLEVGGRVRDYRRERLEGDKRLLLQGIKDLEIDYAVGKMEEAEYQNLLSSARSRAVEIIGRLQADDERWRAEAEKLLTGTAPASGGPAPSAASSEPARPAPAPAAPQPRPPSVEADVRVFPREVAAFIPVAGENLVTCEACGFENDADAHFCSGCGRARKTAA